MRMENKNPAGALVTSCESDEACEIVSCQVCLKEIPGSAAKNLEGADYVLHFCGLECMHAWEERDKKENA
jgi:Domain of unknown function (DUF3330)